MIDGVEGAAQVEQDQDTDMPTTVHVAHYSVVDVDHGGFGRMVCAVRGLTRWQQIVRFHVLIEAYNHHSFYGFRYEAKIGDGSVGVQVVRSSGESSFNCGLTMVCFWLGGSTPSTNDALQMLAIMPDRTGTVA